MSRSCLSTELFTLPKADYDRQISEIKFNFARVLSHIDYMLFEIESGYIRDKRIYYCDTYTVEELRSLLADRLLVFASADKYRDARYALRKNSKKRSYKYLR